MIGLLYEEADSIHKKRNTDGDPIIDTFYQLQYFCCNNVVLDQDIQNDIRRYVYCKDTDTQAYPGTYGDISYNWIQIHFLLKGAMILNEAEIRKKVQREADIKKRAKSK